MLPAGSLLVLLVVAASADRLAPPVFQQLPPSVYWVATPVLAGDTVLIAGAGLANASISLNGPGFGPAASPAEVWAQSVKTVPPAGCGPPCNLTINTAGHSTVVAVNAPQLAWLGNAGRLTRGGASSEKAGPLSCRPRVEYRPFDPGTPER